MSNNLQTFCFCIRTNNTIKILGILETLLLVVYVAISFPQVKAKNLQSSQYNLVTLVFVPFFCILPNVLLFFYVLIRRWTLFACKLYHYVRIACIITLMFLIVLYEALAILIIKQDYNNQHCNAHIGADSYIDYTREKLQITIDIATKGRSTQGLYTDYNEWLHDGVTA